MNEKIKEAIVTENNGGGLSLFVFSDETRERCVYAHTGYEYTPGSLREDIKALLAGDYPPYDWDGNEDDPQSAWGHEAEWLEKSWRDNIAYTSVVLSIDAAGAVEMVEPCDMGAAAQIEFCEGDDSDCGAMTLINL